MPAYDPDREINGLLYTIPTWVAQIFMTERKAQMDLVTDKAKNNLRTALKFLKDRVEIALGHLNENDSDDQMGSEDTNLGENADAMLENVYYRLNQGLRSDEEVSG